MRKYTSSTQKIKMYMEKYNISEEYAHEIVRGYESLLTFDELKIKYDNPDLGKLPDWVTEEEFNNIIWKSIHSMYDNKYSYWTTKDDLHSDLYIFLLQRINNFNSLAHLKTGAVNRLHWLLKQQILRSQYFGIGLDEPIKSKTGDGSVTEYGNLIPSFNLDEQDKNFLATLDSINDKCVRATLIVYGYLGCSIQCLRRAYLGILRESDPDIRQNVLELEEAVCNNDEIQLSKYTDTPLKAKTRKISLSNVIKALSGKNNLFDLVEAETESKSINEYIDYIKYYIKETKLAY